MGEPVWLSGKVPMNLSMESAVLVECCFTSTETGRVPRTSTSTFTQLSSKRTHAGIQYFFVDIVAAVDSKSEQRQKLDRRQHSVLVCTLCTG